MQTVHNSCVTPFIGAQNALESRRARKRAGTKYVFTTSGQDNSIEEILASIRQIISEDDPAPDAQKADESVAPAPEKAGQSAVDDIFELNDRVEDNAAPAPEPPVAAAVPEPAPVMEPEEIQVDLRDRPEEPESDPFFAPLPEGSSSPVEDGSLFTDTAAVATLGAFSKLSDTILLERQKAISGASVTLEDIVKELLSPLLREWIDRHVPVLVEKLVRDELEKLARRAREG